MERTVDDSPFIVEEVEFWRECNDACLFAKAFIAGWTRPTETNPNYVTKECECKPMTINLGAGFWSKHQETESRNNLGPIVGRLKSQ